MIKAFFRILGHRFISRYFDRYKRDLLLQIFSIVQILKLNSNSFYYRSLAH